MQLNRLLTLFVMALGTAGAIPAAADVPFNHGQHFPNGNAAVEHIYGPTGTFRQVSSLQYLYSYYDYCPTYGRPIDRLLLDAQGKSGKQLTLPSDDCHVLADYNQDGNPDSTGGSPAFQEHAGVDGSGTQSGPALGVFWFDDNWIARYMSAAYVRPQPWGLYVPNGLNRFAIIGGDTNGFPSQRYASTNIGDINDPFDFKAFRGLYHVSKLNTPAALAEWNSWIAKSGASYNSNTAEFDYPYVYSAYWLGQFRIFTESLLRYGSLTTQQRDVLVQHSVSLRSRILSTQVNVNGILGGWRSGIADPSSLVNTETVALQVLGLGAGGRWALEASSSPMYRENKNYFIRSTHVISAVPGLSSPGTMVYGPFWRFPTGVMTVDFYVRSSSPANAIGGVDVYDAATGTILGSTVLNAADFQSGNRWTVRTLTVNNGNPTNNLEFRVNWMGTGVLDVAYIQVR